MILIKLMVRFCLHLLERRIIFEIYDPVLSRRIDLLRAFLDD